MLALTFAGSCRPLLAGFVCSEASGWITGSLRLGLTTVKCKFSITKHSHVVEVAAEGSDEAL